MMTAWRRIVDTFDNPAGVCDKEVLKWLAKTQVQSRVLDERRRVILIRTY
jgi:hypothetical protein